MKTLRKSLAILLCMIMTLTVTNMSFSMKVVAAQNNEITLNAGKGTVASGTVALQEDGTLPELPEPTRAGWTFEGWYTDEVMENFWGDEEGETFSALLSKCGNNYQIARDKDFTWIIESKGKLVQEGDTLPDGVSTLYAMYKPSTVTVRWHYNDTSTGVLTHYNKEYGSKLVRAEATGAFAWEGHTLEGWYTKDGTEWTFDTPINDTDRSSVYYISNNPVTADLDLYAHWSNKEPDTIRLSSKDGSGLIEPGKTVSVTVSYSPSNADAPQLNWIVSGASDIVGTQTVSEDGLTYTLFIKNDADVTNNKSVTVIATSKNNPDLSAEFSFTVGHNWKLTGWVDSSCNKTGVKHYQCTNHKTVTKDETIALDGHRYAGGNITTEPTCVDKGARTYTCIVCGDSYDVDVPATGVHTWDNGTVTKEPTCVNTGIKTYSCTACSEVKEEVIPATGKHQFVEITTMNLGKKDHYNSCTVCGKTEFLYTEEVNLDDCTIVLNTSSYTYTGTAKKPTVIVKDGYNVLKNGTDYTVSYSNNVNAGTATVTVTGKGQYTGTEKKTFTIKKADNTITASNFSKTYSTKAQSFSIGAKRSGNAKLTYSSNNKAVTVDSSGKVTIKAKFVGKATITIKSAATDGYKSASKKITITVNPSKPTLSSVKNVNGKKMTVTWKKDTSVTGYQIQYSTDKNFKSGVKTVTVSKNSTISKTINSLQKGKTYNVRVRSYKTVSGTKYYSGWSSTKKVKISK